MSRNFDIEKVAAAIEADLGEALPDIRQALAEVKRGPDARARTSTPAQILLRRTRAQLGLTQEQFARRIATPTATLRDWEQGRFTPPGGILCLLRLLCTHPELASELPAAA